MSANLQKIPLFPALYGACGGLVASYLVGSSEGAKSICHLSDGRSYCRAAIAVSSVGFLVSAKDGYRAGQNKKIGDIYIMKKTDVIALPLLGALSSWLGGFYGAGDFPSELVQKILKVSLQGAGTTTGVALSCYCGWVVGFAIGRRNPSVV